MPTLTFHSGPPPEYLYWINWACLRSSDGSRNIPNDMVASEIKDEHTVSIPH